jgi:hypothetical protein
MTLFAITNYHWSICWMIRFIQFVWLSFIPALTTGNPVYQYLISTKGARWVWPVSRGCLLLLGTWSYLCICRRSVLPYTRFCYCLLDYDYGLHIVNFAILYIKHYVFNAYPVRVRVRINPPQCDIPSYVVRGD